MTVKERVVDMSREPERDAMKVCRKCHETKRAYYDFHFCARSQDNRLLLCRTCKLASQAAGKVRLRMPQHLTLNGVTVGQVWRYRGEESEILSVSVSRLGARAVRKRGRGVEQIPIKHLLAEGVLVRGAA